MADDNPVTGNTNNNKKMKEQGKMRREITRGK
jgi:hypothetical protein